MSEPRLFRPQQFWQPPEAEFEFHPEADDLDLLPENEIDIWAKDMKEHGYDQNYPIGLLDGKIGLGRNRYRAAKKAGVEFLTSTLESGTDLQEARDRSDVNRRHLTPAQQEKRRRGRIERITTALANGKSARAIAKKEGVSHTQVQRDINDIKKTSGTGVPVSEPSKNTAKSSKKSSKSKTGKKPDSETTQKKKEPEELKDAIDCPVPPGLVSVFEKAKEFDEIVNQLNAINRKLKELSEHSAGACLRLQGAQIDLKNLKEAIRFDTPYVVCPVCKGIAKTRKPNCPCKQRGWLVEGAYKNLPQEYRA